MRGVALLVAAGLWSGAAQADPAQLADCAAVQDPAARLACYDALPRGTTAAPAPAAPTPAPGTVAPPTAPAAAAAPPAAEPRRVAPPTDFGLPKADDDYTLEARIVGPVTGWTRGTRFRLDNGQVWQVIGDKDVDHLELVDPRIFIRRSFFGGYRMNFEGTDREAKVRRVS